MRTSLRSIYILVFCILGIVPVSRATKSAASPLQTEVRTEKARSDGDLYDSDKMSPMGWTAYLAGTGRLDKAISKARAHPNTRLAALSGRPNVKRIQADEDDEEEEGDDDFGEGPA